MNAPESVAQASVESVWSFLKSGGPVMIPIGLCSVVATALVLERYARLSRRAACPAGLDEALAAVGRGDDAAALAACTKADAPATRVLSAAIRRRGFAAADIERAMEDQGGKEADRMRANVKPLGLIVGLAPLLGLFGTVVGIYEAFHVVARSNALGKAQQLASGIEVALITTIAGLIVAMPVQCAYFHLNARVKAVLGHLEDRLAGVVEQLTKPAAEATRAS